MAIRLSNALAEEIRKHGIDDFPFECCGVMLGKALGDDKTVHELRRLENVHEDGHERRFRISPDQMFQLDKEARQSGLTILGFYHSHPNHPAQPSQYDRDWAWPWYSYIILSVRDRIPAEMTCWNLNDDREAFTGEELDITEDQMQ